MTERGAGRRRPRGTTASTVAAAATVGVTGLTLAWAVHTAPPSSAAPTTSGAVAADRAAIARLHHDITATRSRLASDGVTLPAASTAPVHAGATAPAAGGTATAGGGSSATSTPGAAGTGTTGSPGGSGASTPAAGGGGSGVVSASGGGGAPSTVVTSPPVTSPPTTSPPATTPPTTAPPVTTTTGASKAKP